MNGNSNALLQPHGYGYRAGVPALEYMGLEGRVDPNWPVLRRDWVCEVYVLSAPKRTSREQELNYRLIVVDLTGGFLMPQTAWVPGTNCTEETSVCGLLCTLSVRERSPDNWRVSMGTSSPFAQLGEGLWNAFQHELLSLSAKAEK